MKPPICPDCNHLILEHQDHFCMHVGCKCNISKATAQAMYERDLFKKKYELAIEGLEDARTLSGSNPRLTEVIYRAFKNIDEVENA